MLGILAGLKQEARLIRRFLPDAPIALSNATPEGAQRGAERLVRAGATRLLSFGCAGALSPALKPGTIIVADHVRVDGKNIPTDARLTRDFGGNHARQGGVLHSDVIVETVLEKEWYERDSHCLAVDMESGAVAQRGLPFAVLRVVCDDARHNLPPAVGQGMENGRIDPAAFCKSLLLHPTQIGGLIRLGAEAAKAQQSMIRFLEDHPPRIR
ncbi:nucleoside phosphorylase-I family protein [Gluconobacter morbifer]|uniref:Nucleoside phosphorylase domain-containing protein n=1 Tax=Gluconobacter morbifer G707 TaxID=1088869 RepID=G6XHR6_9PROT|nr:hypothetical protein [Gluconobacter morbifer]EHH68290.1 hypothetical protein GMO_10600 [Gluconobacter morbifer G707]